MKRTLMILSIAAAFSVQGTSAPAMPGAGAETATGPAQGYQIFKTSSNHLARVVVTMYHPVPEQTNSEPDRVADGTRFNIHQASSLRWIAVSRDLHERWGGPLRFGDIVYLHVNDFDGKAKSGLYKVKDLMNSRFTTRVDILETPGTPIYKFQSADLFLVDHERLSGDARRVLYLNGFSFH